MPLPPESSDFSFYPAGMRPVSFPVVSAESARAACGRVSALLHDHLMVRPDLVDEARDGWEGVYREEFDEAWRVQEARLVGLKESLQRLSGNIADAVANVESLNARRAVLRDDHLVNQDMAAGAD